VRIRHNGTVAVERRTGAASTGVKGLDEILGGGLPRDRLFLVQGDPGVGKTTLALQFIRAGIEAGERGLYIALAESKEELASVAASHGWSLDGFETFELQANAMRGADDDNSLFHPADIELAETTAALLEVVDRIRPDRVVFDSLSELRLLAQNSLRYRRSVLSLKQELAARHVTVMMLDDRTARDGDEQLRSIAHGVLSLDQLAPLYGGDRRRLRVAKIRGIKTTGGYHDFTVQTGGLEVFPRLIASEHAEQFTHGRAQSGVPDLDAILGGGIDRGSSVVFMGPPGSGKSMMAMQFAVAAATRGENAAVFIFDETKKMVALRAEGIGLKLEGHPGKLELHQIDPAEMSPGEFVHAVRHAVEERGVRLVLIDSLNGYLNAMPEEQFLTLQMHELLAYLSNRGVVTILILAQAGVMGSMQTPVDISYLADSVVLLRYFETRGRLRRAVSVLKRRGGSHETNIRELEVSASGLRVGRPLDEFHGIMTGVPQFAPHRNGGPGDQPSGE
jgi:circadian clock protein KaiC